MAKINLKFLDFINEDTHIKVKHETSKHYVFNEWKNTEVLSIDLYQHGGFEACIELDISTAIKFAKTLRTEINKAKEVQNG
tara:strand:+ start:129 stop:371 length:243 start_codon:yes stop_codon:yes gene_type:complete